MHVAAQSNGTIDSLLKVTSATKFDSTKAESYYQLGIAYHGLDSNAELISHLKADKLFSKIEFKSNSILNKVRLGYCYSDLGKFSESERYFLDAISIANKNKNITLEYEALESYLDQFKNINSPTKSLERIFELKERIISSQDKRLLFNHYQLVNQQYVILGTKIEVRKKNAQTMLAIAEEMKDTGLLQTAYFNLAVSSLSQEAIDFYLTSLKYSNRERDKNYMSSVFNNLSAKYRLEGMIDEAINYADSAYLLSKEIGRKEGMGAAKLRKAEGLYFKHDFNGCIKNAEEAMKIFKNANILRRQDACVLAISLAYKELGNYKKALEYLELKNELKDSLEIMTQAKEAEFVDRKFAYELAQKKDSTAYAQERALSSLHLENANNKLQKEKTQRYALIGGCLLVLVLAITLWIGFQRKKKDHQIIEQRNILVEEKNQEIMDSISYAKRIQNAILPQDKIVKEYLKDSFILYKPKDIVAGDFYWMEHRDGKVLFAAADCTGHGVPGAMVSVVCNNALNRSVREHGLLDPGKILDKTREIVIQEFEKSDDEVKDGMDIALCSLNGDELQYAGANNPLWLVRKGELMETKADKQPIGQSDNPEPYSTHTIKLQKEDAIYIFSDGYVDQFGGEKGKKFKAQALRELLLSMEKETMANQKKLIEETFEKWKGNLEQVDDVCVIGVRV